MSAVLQNPELIDPLHDYSGLSLLHRTFNGLNRNENLKKDDMQSVLETLAVKSSSSLLEQAKTVLNSSSELQNSKFSQGTQSTYMDQDIPPRVNIRPQERRPGLGLKRARFSLRPSTSKSSLGEGMSLNIDQLQDPEEFFLAFENLERAEKELRIRRGELPKDSTQHTYSTTARIRRPGILGTKAVNKYRSPSFIAKLDEKLDTSQKLSEVDICRPRNRILKAAITDEHGASHEKKLADDGCMGATQDSVAEEKNKVGGLLDELLSDDDEAIQYLQERFQIRPIHLGKICLPEVVSLCKSDAKVSLEQLPGQMKAFSSIHNVTKRRTSIGSVKRPQLAMSSTYSPDSPTPPRSPFSSTSMFSKHLSEAELPTNPFLFSVVDHTSPVRDSTSVEGIDKGAALLQVDSDSEPPEVNENQLSFSVKFVSMIAENNSADKVATEDSAHSLDPVDDSSSKFGGLEEKVEDVRQLETVGKEKNPVITDDSSNSPNPAEDNLHELSNSTYLSSKGCDNDLEDKFEDMQQMETVGSEQIELSCDGFIRENLECPGSLLGPTINKVPERNELSENTAIHPKQNNQESPRESLSVRSKQKEPSCNGRKRQVPHTKSHAGESLNAQSKRKSVSVRKTREVTRRKSLAGVGTQWQGGVRRSTRFKTRPLEFWIGERLVYGRVHESLLTVIGCKYASPTKGGEKPCLKVQSLVSDQYKDLVKKSSVL